MGFQSQQFKNKAVATMKEEANHISWRQRRGYETTDTNDELILVQAPIEQVAQAYNQLQQAVYWERDVYEREIVIQGYSLLIFQFQGHPWTLMHELPIRTCNVLLDEQEAQALSSLLSTKVIYFLISDTGSKIGYHLYNCGESMEKLFFTSEVEEELDEDEDDEDEDEELEGTYQFQSQIRQLKAEDIKYPYGFVEEFLQEQDAYVPAFFSKTTFRVGQRVTIQLEGIKRSDFERMDYMVLNQGTS